jgi:hypothetical protein
MTDDGRDTRTDVGTAGGAAAGAPAGTVTLGPIGAIVGALAVAIGGGWTALAAAAPAHYSPEHDRPYETARPAYQLGHLAARNPDYSRREFGSVEGDLRGAWGEAVRAGFGDWRVVRRYAREAFVRDRARSQSRARVELTMTDSDTDEGPSC